MGIGYEAVSSARDDGRHRYPALVPRREPQRERQLTGQANRNPPVSEEWTVRTVVLRGRLTGPDPSISHLQFKEFLNPARESHRSRPPTHFSLPSINQITDPESNKESPLLIHPSPHPPHGIVATHIHLSGNLPFPTSPLTPIGT